MVSTIRVVHLENCQEFDIAAQTSDGPAILAPWRQICLKFDSPRWTSFVASIAHATTMERQTQFRWSVPLLMPMLVFPVAAAVAQTTSSSLTLYGRTTAAVDYRTDQASGKGSVNLANSTFSPSNFGLRGVEDLGGGMRAMFCLESGIAIDTGAPVNAAKFWNCESPVGLALNSVVLLTLGRQLHAGPERVAQSLDVTTYPDRAWR